MSLAKGMSRWLWMVTNVSYLIMSVARVVSYISSLQSTRVLSAEDNFPPMLGIYANTFLLSGCCFHCTKLDPTTAYIISQTSFAHTWTETELWRGPVLILLSFLLSFLPWHLRWFHRGACPSFFNRFIFLCQFSIPASIISLQYG